VQQIWVFVFGHLLGDSSDRFIGSNINLPVKLVSPTENRYVDKTCSWISITDITVPGLLLSYLYRFDRAKGIK